LSVQWHPVDLRSVNELISTSALTSDDVDVPEGHYADETMKITVVLARVACEGFITPDFFVKAPYVHMTKADICARGHGLGVDWKDTWSCYKGGDIHCGRCSTCLERREAFSIAKVEDPTTYEDLNFYQELVAAGTLQ
jgi:7-cyano-7-deazaguanine synthase